MVALLSSLVRAPTKNRLRVDEGLCVGGVGGVGWPACMGWSVRRQGVSGWLSLAVLVWFASIAGRPVHAQSGLSFHDATQASRLDFTHEDGVAEGSGFLVSFMGSGLASLDYDNDGWIDAYFLNGASLKGLQAAPAPLNQLYRNRDGQTWQRTTRWARLHEEQFSLGAAVADFDNDGFKDIAASNFGSVSLLRNLGDGTFEDVTGAAGVSNSGVVFGAGVAWFDIENDGDLDLYVADYVEFNFPRYERLLPTAFPYSPGPDDFEYRHDRLFLNDGAGGFSDISEASGIGSVAAPSMGVTCGDFDADGDIDIFVCCDARPNLLFVNDGNGRFQEEAELYAAATNSAGVPVGSMGVEAGDIDNDGLEDLFVTDYSGQAPILFRNAEAFGFEDITQSSRAGQEVVPHANWGAGLVDFDNDGDRDLMIANGHLLKNAHAIEPLTEYKVKNSLLANDGSGRFVSVTGESGDGMQLIESSRGLAFEDFDNDGDVDCVVSNHAAAANYLQNRSPNQAHWVQLILQGERFNRDGVGARVTVLSEGLAQVAEQRSGRGYQSSYGARLYFGIGAGQAVDRVFVDWGGDRIEYGGLEVNRQYILTEGGDVLLVEDGGNHPRD
ncbi:FG-GAP repeat protein [Aureliella helgolandensis]|uniref:FG-GAP repeat protein n=2 Tax=Aureliella helgolandensis TaxID=2527968 RepID=A0A518GGN3_9BACT|nr:FG-GAP repeat protein [Aureliella helgolandensis]